MCMCLCFSFLAFPKTVHTLSFISPLNNSVLTVKGTIYALKYNSMFSAGNYNFGIVKNNGKLQVDNLTINDSYLSVQVPAIVHDWKLVEKIESGCNYNEYEKYICSVCQEEKYITSESKGHNFSSYSEYCLNGCGIANPNYVAPTPTSTQPTQTSKTVAKPKSAKIKKVKTAKKFIPLGQRLKQSKQSKKIPSTLDCVGGITVCDIITVPNHTAFFDKQNN